MPRQHMPNRPLRVKLKDEWGRFNSLACGTDHFQAFGRGRYILLLGLGPQPEILPKLLPRDLPVFYLETDDFTRQMPQDWSQSIPGHWKKLDPEELTSDFIANCQVIYYRFASRLFPGFWQPIIARCRLIHLLPHPGETRQDTICLPADPKDLLAPELYQAFTHLGFKVITLPAELDESALVKLLQSLRPNLFLSVNFRGLDPYGNNFHLLQAAGIPVAIWCVDNPFHLLCGLKSPFWKEALLFITDSWFKQALREHGARYVFHLPLATSPKLFQAKHPQSINSLKDSLVFVGRSAFPHKKGFFAASTVADTLLEKAEHKLRSGQRPDFAWWQNILKLKELWPGQQVRQAGLGAESSSQSWRIYCLQICAALAKLTVYGDDKWSELLPQEVHIKKEVDYYGPLADIYTSAAYNLNLTSMLLPRGLTQRHFDVWSAGGFLLTDFTKGLEIFPQELTQPISFKHPKQLSQIMDNLQKDPGLYAHLSLAWYNLIRKEHTYLQRAEHILKIVQGAQGK